MDYDGDYWRQVEDEIVISLSNRYGCGDPQARDIINMMHSICSTRGAALMHIENYLSRHDTI